MNPSYHPDEEVPQAACQQRPPVASPRPLHLLCPARAWTHRAQQSRSLARPQPGKARGRCRGRRGRRQVSLGPVLPRLLPAVQWAPSPTAAVGSVTGPRAWGGKGFPGEPQDPAPGLASRPTCPPLSGRPTCSHLVRQTHLFTPCQESHLFTPGQADSPVHTWSGAPWLQRFTLPPGVCWLLPAGSCPTP